VLYVAALFHDVAKGRGGDHSELGAREVRRFCRDHGIPRDDAQLIEFLVRHHLTMSRIAQKEDLSDPRSSPLRRAGGHERRLTALYLLTVADIRGTSPKVWNAWKGKLLEDLYRLTLRALGGARPNLDAEIEARKQEARQNLALHSALPGTEEPLWKTLEVSYFARHDAADIAWHARSLWRHIETRCRSCARGPRRSATACRCWSTPRPARPVRTHLRLLRQRRLQHPGRQDPHHARRLRARHLPGRPRSWPTATTPATAT
jgi:[protein-PII] uridylyltransferase